MILLQLCMVLATYPFVFCCEKENCTDGVTKQYLLEETSSRSSLAWLVTPALFAVGVCYLVYKCCKDGLCNCRRLRERAARESDEDPGYIPLNEVALLSTSQIPYVHAGMASRAGAHQLVVVHNQTFCLAVDPTRHQNSRRGACGTPVGSGFMPLAHPPTYQEALLQSEGGINQEHEYPDVQVVANPPSYISSKPPRYSVAMGLDSSTHTSVNEDLNVEPDIIVVSTDNRPRHLKFISSRRRHRSAQDSHSKQERHRHFSAQDRRSSIQNEDDSVNRQRCFSFNALRDAFKRSQQSVTPSECESLLAEDHSNDLFLSRDYVDPGLLMHHNGLSSTRDNTSTPQPLTFVTTSVITTTSRIQRRPPQQVSFEDRILEDSESNENVEQPTSSSTLSHQTDPRLRQRHFSAPDTTQTKATKSRHFSGNS